MLPSSLLLLALPVAIRAQWPQQNFNPFAQWQQPNLNLFFPMQHQAQPQHATALEIYGEPGKRNANQKLRTCCRQLKDADVECRRKFCDFDAIASAHVLPFLAQCVSKGPTVGQMWDCASSRADHTACCQRQGVLPACMAYCETTKGVPTDVVKYGFCIAQFDKIRFCFKEHLESHPNIKGDT